MSLYQQIEDYMSDGLPRCANQVSFDLNQPAKGVEKALNEMVEAGTLAHIRMIGNKNGYILVQHGGYGGAA